MKRQILIRLTLAALTLLASLRSIFDAESFSHRITVLGGLEASAVLISMGVLALIAMTDVAINDILPARWHFPAAHRYRHLVWGVLGCLYSGCAFVLVRSDSNPWAAATFVMFGVSCMAVAFMDLRYRALDQQAWERAQ